MTARAQELEPATTPLLDPANVGKYVWYVWNSNARHASKVKIVKVTRTNVHVETNRNKPESLRVNEDGGSASGTVNGFGCSVETEQHRTEKAERRELVTALRRKMDHGHWLTTDQLRRIKTILDES